MKYFYGFCIFSLLLIVSCISSNKESNVNYRIDSLDNKLISVTIDSMLNCYKSESLDSTKRIILIDSTSAVFNNKYIDLLNILKVNVKDSSLINSFINRNKHKVRIYDSLDCNTKFILLSNSILKDIFKKYEPSQGWDKIYEKYKINYGIVSISRFGINTKQDLAITLFSISFDADNGRKKLIILQLVNNVWRIKDQITLLVY